METNALQGASALFIGLVVALYLLVLRGTYQAFRQQGPQSAATARSRTLVAAAVLLLWLAVCAAVAGSGFLSDFNARPPRLMLVLPLPLLTAVWLARSEAVGRLLDAMPRAGLVALQSFRVLMEVVLWLLFVGGEIPVQMTFEGLNYDILTGLTAPIIAYFCFVRRSWPWQVAFGWNIAGLLILVNIVTIAFLSAPLPIRYFFNEPANTIVARFPMVWLPCFVVPLAYTLHVLSMRQLLRRAAAARVPTPPHAASLA
ncbi:hypothetical protein [Solirubrum puertoriconensis]|uniref:Uncharacterized protein n=1 Tax=Solirubrum puertoriconensis TaxID=1751427 RepID=A0A9X0HIM7_SOLP1|nr:hypothetical protein [Solirubrum puertoriconensis]KUG06584.1 hypothetical protein ASU33_04360 [Solirubrum puertoriconensis]